LSVSYLTVLLSQTTEFPFKAIKYYFAAHHDTATPCHTFGNFQLFLLARHAEYHPDDKVCLINSRCENNLKIDQEQTRYEIISQGLA